MSQVATAQHALNQHKLEVDIKTRQVEQAQRRLADAIIRHDTEEEMKLELQLGKAKTELFLMKNQTFKLQGDLNIVEKELNGLEFHHNKVWDDIIINEQTGKSKKAKFNSIKKRYPHLSQNTNAGLLRFGMHLVQKFKQHQITVEAARKFSGNWRLSLDEIREERVKYIQRAYRKRREDRIAIAAAQRQADAKRAIALATAKEEVSPNGPLCHLLRRFLHLRRCFARLSSESRRQRTVGNLLRPKDRWLACGRYFVRAACRISGTKNDRTSSSKAPLLLRQSDGSGR